MLCEGAERPPEGREWCYELKLDGYRAMGRKAGRSTQLWSRNLKDFTRRFPAITKAIGELPSDTIIDGEIVALDENGRPSFELLQGFGRRAPLIVVYAFDLLMLRSRDTRFWPLEELRDQLRQIVEQLPDTIRYSENFNVPLPDLMVELNKHHLEGIVAKHAGSPILRGTLR